MSKLQLPAQIHPPRIKKDGSCSITFDSRELSGEEYMMILGFRNTEGTLLYSPNEISFDDIEVMPKSDLTRKTESQRLRAVLYILYKQSSDSGKFIGTWETYYKEQMEKLIERLKGFIED